jgi:hypothetical protein
LIGGVIKYFRFSWEYVLWEISFPNLNMLLATIPVYEPVKAEKKEAKGGEETSLTDIFKEDQWQ